MKSGELKSNRLQNIEEENVGDWLPVVCPQPETPTESMEFLARSWSVSAVELSKALCATNGQEKPHRGSFLFSHNQPSLASESPPESPRGSDDAKELLVLDQALNPDLVSHQHLLRLVQLQQIYRTIVKRKKVGRRDKDQKERKKHEIRAHNAQLHAAVSVAGVAAAVAALTASSLASPEKSSSSKAKKPNSKKPAAVASAAALVASHCIEIAEDMGADRGRILAAVQSAINARTNGDVMALTAGAATALRGAATLRARLRREGGGSAAVVLADESGRNGKGSNVTVLLDFVSRGGELLKKTRKGDLHWKQVSLNINSNWEVVAKMKSKHIGGTFTKKKKCVVSGVYTDVPAWPGRETEEEAEEMAYFAVQTADRVIEFECRNKEEREMWVEGIQNMLHLHVV